MTGFIKDRYAYPTLDRVLNGFEVGKYRAMWDTALMLGKANQSMMQNVLEVSSLIKDMVFGGYIDLGVSLFGKKSNIPSKIVDNYALFVYQKYKQKYNLDITQAEFKKVMEGKIRSMLREISTIITFSLALVGWALAKGDDDKDKHYLWGKVNKIMKKYLTEITFALNPASAQELSKSAIPLMTLGVDFFNVIKNAGDEVRDSIIGENSKTDATPSLYYTMKLLPIISQVYNLTELEALGVEIKPNEGEQGVQITK
jgi:hypothetical protein